MNLQSIHLASYLPYGLRIKSATTEKPLTGLYLDELNNTLFGFGTTFKPILRPLSDLTTEIEINGIKFVPINILNYISDIHLRINGEIEGFSGIPVYDDFQKLFKWHFDVFGLIDAGLAIDINTIKI